MIYTVYFEFGGKKYKKQVEADNKTLAIIKVKESIQIIKVKEHGLDDFMEKFGDLLDKLK
jgi:hypothetical protein